MSHRPGGTTEASHACEEPTHTPPYMDHVSSGGKQQAQMPLSDYTRALKCMAAPSQIDTLPSWWSVHLDAAVCPPASAAWFVK